MFGFCTDSDRFKDEALDFEHVEWIIFLHGNFVFAYVVEELLEQRIVWMLQQIKQIVFYDLK